MPTFFECYLNNNPDANDEIVSALSASVLDAISSGPVVESLSGIINGVNDTFTTSQIPNPTSSLVVSLISGGGFTQLVAGVDYSTAVISEVFTIQLTTPPVIGENVQGVYYAL